jgi:hypothetical protein
MVEYWRQNINNKCWNFGPKGCKLASQIQWYPFSSLGGQYKPIKSAFISNLGQIEKNFSSSALTPSVKPLWLISTFPPIEILDLGWTLALTPSVKWALVYGLVGNRTFLMGTEGRISHWVSWQLGISYGNRGKDCSLQASSPSWNGIWWTYFFVQSKQ